MIRLTRLDNREFILNCDLIEFIEAMPDTIITLRTEKKILVKEGVDEVLKRILDFKQSVFSQPFYKNDEKIYVRSEGSGAFYSDYDLKKLKELKDVDLIEEDDDEYDDDDDE